MLVKVLLNPYANRWNARRRWSEAADALHSFGIDFELAASEGPGHLEQLAREAVKDGFETLVIAGGDGSIGEVLNGAAADWSPGSPFPVAFGLLPLGSANDLADNIGLPRDLRAAAGVIAAARGRAIDLGRCNQRYFLNNSAAGLEPYVTTKQERITWLKGMPRYLVAAVQGILDKPEWNAKLEWDDDQRYDGPLSLISVGNGPRTGGVFYMSPHADPFDGKLTFSHGYRSTRLGLFAALPRAMKRGEGSFIEMRGMYEMHCTRLRVSLDAPSPVHTDGELFPEWLKDMEYAVYPSAARILM